MGGYEGGEWGKEGDILQQVEKEKNSNTYAVRDPLARNRAPACVVRQTSPALLFPLSFTKRRTPQASASRMTVLAVRLVKRR